MVNVDDPDGIAPLSTHPALYRLYRCTHQVYVALYVDTSVAKLRWVFSHNIASKLLIV